MYLCSSSGSRSAIFYMLQTLLTAEIFGFVSLGSVLGVMTLMTQVGSGFGPFLVGWAEDSTGSYRTPFVITGIATIAAALLILLARPVDPGSINVGSSNE